MARIIALWKLLYAVLGSTVLRRRFSEAALLSDVVAGFGRDRNSDTVLYDSVVLHSMRQK